MFRHLREGYAMCRIDRVVAGLKDNFFRAVRSCKAGPVPLQVAIVMHRFGDSMDSPVDCKPLPRYKEMEFSKQLHEWLTAKSMEMEGATPAEAAHWLQMERKFEDQIRIFASFEECAVWWVQPGRERLDACDPYLYHDGAWILKIGIWRDR
jgi:hypothetical protein